MAAQVRRLGLWAVLAAFVALTTYGFLHQNLLHQETWTALGLKRVLIFAACYALVFAAFAMWKPRLFFAAVLVAVLGYTAVAVGLVPLLTVGLILLSSLVLGQTVLARSCSAILAMLLGLSIYMFALSIAALAPINYPAVYLAALAAPLVWKFVLSRTPLADSRGSEALIPSRDREEAVAKSKAERHIGTPSFWKLRLTNIQHAAAGLLIFVLLLHWLVALEPEAGPDGLAVHLAVPASVALTHQWAFDVTRHLWAVMPMGADWCFTLAYLLGGEAAARLLNLALFLSITILLLSTIRKWLPLAPALLTVAMFASTPLVQLVTGSLFAENLWALLCLGALLAVIQYRESGREAYLYVCFVLLGAAASAKFGALAFLPPFGLIALWTLFGTRRKSVAGSAKTASLAFACFLVFAAPPYVTAGMKTGDPVFPYLPRIFPSRYSVPAGSGSPTGPRAHLALSTLYDLTFHTSSFREVQDGAFGFQYLLFLPLSILLLRRNWPDLAMLSGFALVLFAPVALGTEPDVRYLYPAFPLATLFIAAALSTMRGVYSRLYQIALAITGVIVCLDLYFLPSSNWMFKDFVSNPASSRARAEYVTAHAPERNLVAYLNRAHAGAPVAFFESSSIAELQGEAFTTSWHNQEFYNRILAASSPTGCLRVLEDYGIRFVVAPFPQGPILIKTTPVAAFLQQCVEPEFSSGTFYAGRVKESCPSGAGQPTPSLPPGEYDDFDPRIEYQGLWSRGRFPDASGATITSSNSTGAALIVRFTGAEVVYVYTKAFNRGIAEITLDGESQGTLDLYSPQIEWKTATPYRATDPGPHTLKIRVTGRKNPAATDVFVDVDALIVR